MVNVEIRMLEAPDGTPVCNVGFDLSAGQLAATARATEAVRLRRHRGQEMDSDDVLAMQELTAVVDELSRLAEHQAHGTVVLPLARFTALHDALSEWLHELDERGWAREGEQEDRPLIEALTGPMESARTDAVCAVLGGDVTSPR